VRGGRGGIGSSDAVLLGDFNAYAMEDPIRTLHAAGWRDAFALAKVERPYSYVYNGMTGRWDHALLSPGMAQRLRAAAECRRGRRCRLPRPQRSRPMAQLGP